MEKIHEICIKVKYDISRLKYVTLLKEEIYNRPVLTCPYRTETIVFHSDRKNYMLPSHGVNKLINYDVSKVVFKPCIRAECAMYDLATGTCRARI